MGGETIRMVDRVKGERRENKKRTKETDTAKETENNGTSNERRRRTR